jgi:hypothetical protein
VALGDFNGDGISDVAVADFLSDKILVMTGERASGFRLAARLPSSAGPRSIVAADFNHDGLMDLAVANFFSGTVAVFLGRGDGSFEDPRSLQVGKGAASIVTADFDADGIPDLAVANFFSGEAVILKEVGDGTFQVRSRLGPIRAVSYLYSADFNHNGLEDLLAFDASGKQAWLFAGERGGSFKAPVSLDLKAAVTLISTEEPGRGILPSELRRLKKIAGDGQWAPAGSVLPQALVVEVGEQGGRPSAGEKVSFSGLYGNSGMVESSARQSDEQGRASAALSLGSLPGNVMVAAKVHEGPVTVFGMASTLAAKEFFTRITAALAQWSGDAAGISEHLTFVNDAEQKLKSGDEVGAVAKLAAGQELLTQSVARQTQGSASTTNASNMMRRLINQVVLFGSSSPDVTGTISCGKTVSGTLAAGTQDF